MREIVLVGLGGMIGSVLRYLASSAVQQWAGPGHFPFGTLFVNLTGAFLLGVLVEGLAQAGTLSPALRLLLGVGLLGGYTTFSTLTLDAVSLAADAEYTAAFLYAVGSLALGLAATWAGIQGTRWVVSLS